MCSKIAFLIVILEVYNSFTSVLTRLPVGSKNWNILDQLKFLNHQCGLLNGVKYAPKAQVATKEWEFKVQTCFKAKLLAFNPHMLRKI